MTVLIVLGSILTYILCGLVFVKRVAMEEWGLEFFYGDEIPIIILGVLWPLGFLVWGLVWFWNRI